VSCRVPAVRLLLCRVFVFCVVMTTGQVCNESTVVLVKGVIYSQARVVNNQKLLLHRERDEGKGGNAKSVSVHSN